MIPIMSKKEVKQHWVLWPARLLVRFMHRLARTEATFRRIDVQETICHRVALPITQYFAKALLFGLPMCAVYFLLNGLWVATGWDRPHKPTTILLIGALYGLLMAAFLNPLARLLTGMWAKLKMNPAS